MKRASAEGTPVLLHFASELARADAWGRLTELSSTSACLSTMTRLERREKVMISFDLAGERWKNIPAEVNWAQTDADGYCAVELRFLDMVVARRLSKALLEVLAR